MSKKIDWASTYTPKVGNVSGGTFPGAKKAESMRQRFQKGQSEVLEQQKAEEVLKKAFPVMSNILLQRMTEHRPIKVVRPLPYTTEVLGGEEEDDGFYANVVKGANATFKSVTKFIPQGTELTFTQLEKSMNQLWFRTQDGEEVGIYVEEQIRLMTHTDIYQLVASHLSEE